jgi:hypothetical protein
LLLVVVVLLLLQLLLLPLLLPLLLLLLLLLLLSLPLPLPLSVLSHVSLGMQIYVSAGLRLPPRSGRQESSLWLSGWHEGFGVPCQALAAIFPFALARGIAASPRFGYSVTSGRSSPGRARALDATPGNDIGSS